MSDQGFDIHSRTTERNLLAKRLIAEVVGEAKQPKKFKRHITGDELIAACKENEFPCFCHDWLYRGQDAIRFGFHHCGTCVDALYYPASGRASCSYWSGIGQVQRFQLYRRRSYQFDVTPPWFDALLAFLYRE